MNVTSLIAAANSKNMIFSVSPGRSGTTLLTNLLALLPDTLALHEEYPGYDHVLRYVQTNPAIATQFIVAHKLPHIASSKEANYIETSHLFCKGFLEAFINLGIRFKLVDLRRHPRDVATSMYGYNSIPARTNDGLSHYLSPDDPGVLPLPHWTGMHDYQICFWHSLEIERRQRLYGEWMKRSGMQIFTIVMDEMTDFNHYRQLCESLQLADTGQYSDLEERHRRISATNQNPKKKFRAIDFDRDQLESQVINLISCYHPFLWSDIDQFYKARKKD